jgi:hypothetical protein
LLAWLAVLLDRSFAKSFTLCLIGQVTAASPGNLMVGLAALLDLMNFGVRAAKPGKALA